MFLDVAELLWGNVVMLLGMLLDVVGILLR
jgi:hypothetical protein